MTWGINIYFVFIFYNWDKVIKGLGDECSSICKFLIVIALSCEYFQILTDIEKAITYRILIKITAENISGKSISKKIHNFIKNKIKRKIK